MKFSAGTTSSFSIVFFFGEERTVHTKIDATEPNTLIPIPATNDAISLYTLSLSLSL